MTNFLPPLPLMPSNSARPTPSTSRPTSPMLEEAPLSSNAQGKKPANRNRDDIPSPRLPHRRAERPSFPPPLPFYHLPALSMPSPTIRPSSGDWDSQLPWETVQEEEEARARAQARDWRQWLPGGSVSFPAADHLVTAPPLDLDQEEVLGGGGGEEFRKYMQRYNMSSYYENENSLSEPSLFNTAATDEEPDLYGCCSWMTRIPEEELHRAMMKKGPGGGSDVGSASDDNDEMSIDGNGNGNVAGPVSNGRKSKGKGKGKGKREEGELINRRGRARNTLTTPRAYPNNASSPRTHSDHDPSQNPWSPTLDLRIPFSRDGIAAEPAEAAESMDWRREIGSENTVVEIRLRDDEDLWEILGVLAGRGERL